MTELVEDNQSHNSSSNVNRISMVSMVMDSQVKHHYPEKKAVTIIIGSSASNGREVKPKILSS